MISLESSRSLHGILSSPLYQSVKSMHMFKLLTGSYKWGVSQDRSVMTIWAIMPRCSSSRASPRSGPVSSGFSRAVCLAVVLSTVSCTSVEANSACRKSSPITGQPKRVVEAMSRTGPVRGLLFLTQELPIKKGQEIKIIWHLKGEGDLRIAYFGPNERPRKLAWGPTAHEGVALAGPGDEFGAGFRFDAKGCWRIDLERGDVSAQAWISVS
jgi:hypothetical protein